MSDNGKWLDDVGGDGSRFQWRYGAHDLCVIVREFFAGERRERFDDSKFESSFVPDKESDAKTIVRLLKAQDAINGTFARRRLERWVTRVIVTYLAMVFVLIVAHGVVVCLVDEGGLFSDLILVTILSTTTVNVLGMAYIVLKGRFWGHGSGRKSK